jgi:site-specific DNA recombinase
VPIEMFEYVQSKLRTNADLSRRNTKRDYLLTGLLYCSRCGGRMGGHTVRDIAYYHCYRKGNTGNIPLKPDGEPQPCSCPEVRADAVEPVVWDTMCSLIKDPDFLIREIHQRTDNDSQTKEILERELQLCQARLKAIPDEQRRLVEGYRKGLYADFMMREDMEQIHKEQGELEKRRTELERQLAHRQLTQRQEDQIRSLTEKIGMGLDNPDFTAKQEVVRLLVEKVLFDGQGVEIQTIIPIGDQLHPIHREGDRE